LLGYGSYGIKYNKENLKYDVKQIRIEKKPASRPRSWQPELKEHDNWQRARGLRRGRPTRRGKVKLSEDPRTEVKPLGGPRWQ
jgi:hypothetical protein